VIKEIRPDKEKHTEFQLASELERQKTELENTQSEYLRQGHLLADHAAF
jgi:hypothetical protein